MVTDRSIFITFGKMGSNFISFPLKNISDINGRIILELDLAGNRNRHLAQCTFACRDGIEDREVH